MDTNLKHILIGIGGIVFALILYVLPDMMMNLGESVSFWLKVTFVAALLLIGVLQLRAKKTAPAVFTFIVSFVLALLVAFGGIIRLSELGLM